MTFARTFMIALIFCNFGYGAATGGRKFNDVVYKRKTPSAPPKSSPAFTIPFPRRAAQSPLREPCASYARPEVFDPENFKTLMTQLADGDFSAREAASRCLTGLIGTRHADYIAGELRRSLEREGVDSLTLEQSTRVRNVLAGVGKIVKCSFKNIKIQLQSGATSGRVVATPTVAASFQLPAQYSIDSCVLIPDAEALTGYDWSRSSRDPAQTTPEISKQLLSAIVGQSDAQTVLNSRVENVERVQFLSTGAETEMKCVAKTGYCLAETYSPASDAVYECSYSCFCGKKELVSSYDVRTILENPLAGVATMDIFATNMVCPDVCGTSGKPQYDGPLRGVTEMSPTCKRSQSFKTADVGRTEVKLREELVALEGADVEDLPESTGITIISPTHSPRR